MIIGVDSRIGFSFIVGPSLLQNTLYVFQAGGMMSPKAGARRGDSMFPQFRRPTQETELRARTDRPEVPDDS